MSTTGAIFGAGGGDWRERVTGATATGAGGGGDRCRIDGLGSRWAETSGGEGGLLTSVGDCEWWTGRASGGDGSVCSVDIAGDLGGGGDGKSTSDHHGGGGGVGGTGGGIFGGSGGGGG